MTDKETFFLLDAVRLAVSVALHAANVVSPTKRPPPTCAKKKIKSRWTGK